MGPSRLLGLGPVARTVTDPLPTEVMPPLTGPLRLLIPELGPVTTTVSDPLPFPVEFPLAGELPSTGTPERIQEPPTFWGPELLDPFPPVDLPFPFPVFDEPVEFTVVEELPLTGTAETVQEPPTYWGPELLDPFPFPVFDDPVEFLVVGEFPVVKTIPPACQLSTPLVVVAAL